MSNDIKWENAIKSLEKVKTDYSKDLIERVTSFLEKERISLKNPPSMIIEFEGIIVEFKRMENSSFISEEFLFNEENNKIEYILSVNNKVKFIKEDFFNLQNN